MFFLPGTLICIYILEVVTISLNMEIFKFNPRSEDELCPCLLDGLMFFSDSAP